MGLFHLIEELNDRLVVVERDSASWKSKLSKTQMELEDLRRATIDAGHAGRGNPWGC